MTNFAEYEEMMAQWNSGDARRCPRHPHIKTSSDDGMFDTAGCEACEGEMEDAYQAELEAAMTPDERAARDAEAAAESERRFAAAEVRMEADRQAREAGEILF